VLVETGNDGNSDDYMTYGGGLLWDDLHIGGIETFGLRFDYQRYDGSNGDDDIDNLLIGFFYRFGSMGSK